MTEEIPKDAYGEIKNLDEYLLEYQKYKKGNYQFGNYSTKEEILGEFLKGKIFVLKGGLNIGGWILTILMFVIVIVSFFALFIPDPGSVLFITFPILGLPVISFSLLTSRVFLVICPLGFYYRKILSSGIFSWIEVNNIKYFTQTYMGIKVQGIVKIYMFNGGKIRFGSATYLNKEFRRKVKKEIFLNLFYIYSHRGTYIRFI
ncbi:MAG: hypothetical protein ACFE9I_05945 [Candidatus Hermodarchaeota archaeon]